MYIFIVVIFIVLVTYLFLKKRHIEGFLTYKKCKTNKVSGILKDIFTSYDIKEENKDDWDIYLPCGYNRVESELRSITPKNNNQKIFGVSGCDTIVSKNMLWTQLEKKFSRNQAKKIMPETFVLDNSKDMDEFNRSYNKNKIYILKKNVQRKQGLKITNNMSEILNAYKDGFKVVQEYRTDCFVINKRVMNLRIYMLVTCQGNKTSIYLHPRGKCLYSGKDISNNPLDFESRVTNSYALEKDFYKTSPLTLEDLKVYLSKHKYNYKLLFRRINTNIQKLSEAVVTSLCKLDNIKDNTKFQLFGLDVIFNKKMEPYILEINKGPDMAPKNENDKKLKTKVELDMLHSLKIIEINDPKYHNEFYKIHEVK